MLLWSFGDFRYFPGVAAEFLLVRIGVVVWCAIAAVIALRATSSWIKYAATWLWFLAWAVYSAYAIPRTPEHLLSHVFVIVIAQIGSAGIVVWSRSWATTMSLVLAAIGELGLVYVAADRYEVFAAHGYLLSGAALSVVFATLRYRSAREQFQQRLELREQKSHTEELMGEVSRLRDERLRWLEHLARFLRHELKNQIVAVASSIGLAQSAGDLSGLGTYLDRAQRSLTRMRSLVSSATEATGLESALSSDTVQPVDLSAVVAERVAVLDGTAAASRFALQLTPGVLVRGSEGRLAQLVDKLLANAIEHSMVTERIGVVLAILDGTAVLAVDNQGDPLPGDKERIFEAFVSSRKTAENLGLGLFVARSIARNHGGDIIAEDLPENAGARFVVRLPIRVPQAALINGSTKHSTQLQAPWKPGSEVRS